MKITFYDGHGNLAYNPNTELNVGVGGAETVLIQTAKALAKRGHEVSVYINCNFPDIYDDVRYYKYFDYVPQFEDVLVGFENFPAKHTAKKVVNFVNRFYTEDVQRFPDVDKIIVVSQWHKDYFASLLHESLISKMSVVNPGVDESFFDSTIIKQPFNITYSGHPGKGAMPSLIPIMERLKPKLPQAQIHVYGGGGLWGWDNDQYRPIYNKLIKMRVSYHGQIGKDEMKIRLNQAEIFLYPVGSHHKETVPLAILEAMAAGCVIIASDNGNIRNLVGDKGFVIAGDINHYTWSMEVVDKIVKLYNNPELIKELRDKSKEFARLYTWDRTAEEFEKIIL